MSNVFETVDAQQQANPFEVIDAKDDAQAAKLLTPAPAPLTRSTTLQRPDQIPALQNNPLGTLGYYATQPGGPQAMEALKGVAMTGGGAAVGGELGMLGGPAAPITVPIGAGLGAMLGNYLDQKTRPGSAPIKKGELAASAILGMIPGGSMANATGKQLILQGTKYAAQNVAAKAVQTGIDESRLPSPAEASLAAGLGYLGAGAGKLFDSGGNVSPDAAKKLQNAVRDNTLAEWQAAGGVVSPSKINPGFVNNRLESLAGKASTLQQIAIQNQEVTNSLIRKELGLPADAPITESILSQVRADAAKPYQEISSLSPQAAAALGELKQARYEAQSQYNYYSRSANPDALKAAQKAEQDANLLEQKIENAASAAGRSDLVDQLKEARKKIAQSYEVEKALNLGDSNVRAPILGRSLDKGAPLTGGLKTVAQFQQAFPQQMRDAATVPAPGVSKLDAMLGLGSGALGASLGAMNHGPAGAAVGAAASMIPSALSGGARKLILSKFYQESMARPQYREPLPDWAAQFARTATGDIPINPYLQFLADAYPNKQPAKPNSN